MLDALGSLAWRRPWALLGAATAALAALALLAAGVRGQLGHPAPAGEEGRDVLIRVSSEAPVSDAVYGTSLEVIKAGVQAREDVGGVTTVEPAGGDDVAILAVDPAAADAGASRRLADELEAGIDPGPLDVAVSGRIAKLVAAEDSILEDLWRLELLVVPLAALLLVWLLGARLAAGPPLVAAIAIAGALAGLALAGRAADLSMLGIVPAIAVGLALGLELPALIASRWEDEVRLAGPREALTSTISESSGTVAFATGSAALGAAGILAASAGGALLPAGSLALGAALGAAFALIGSALVMPALLALEGRRETAGAGSEPRRERRLAGSLGVAPRGLARTPARTGAGVAVALVASLAIAYPALGARSVALGTSGGSEHLLTRELPLAAAAAGLLVAAAFAARTRGVRAIPLALTAILPAAAAAGILTLVFDDGASLFGLAIETPRVPTSGALAAAVTALAAIAAARTAIAIDATRSERELDPGPPGVAERAGELTLLASLLCTLIVGAAFGVLAGAALPGTQELGSMLALGVLADLLLIRPVTLAALARWGQGDAAAERRRPRLRIGWPAWRRREQGESTASPS